jgi:hypothetical protein
MFLVWSLLKLFFARRVYRLFMFVSFCSRLVPGGWQGHFGWIGMEGVLYYDSEASVALNALYLYERNQLKPVTQAPSLLLQVQVDYG